MLDHASSPCRLNTKKKYPLPPGTYEQQACRESADEFKRGGLVYGLKTRPELALTQL